MRTFKPSQYQRPLPVDQLIRHEPPGRDAAVLDVAFVGAGPAGLAGAIHLKQLVSDDPSPRIRALEVGVLEKSSALGEHNLSGALLNPTSLLQLFPDLSPGTYPLLHPVREDRVYFMTEREAVRVPTPPSMKNQGNYYVSICELVRWLGDKAEDLGVQIFTGFSAAALLAERDQIIGVRTLPEGDIRAQITVLAEGTRGALTQAYLDWQKIAAANPQIYALAVKELWDVPEASPIAIHTLGWPLPSSVFGGSFIYPMGADQVSFGLVVGLDYPQSTLDVHLLLQKMKKHPLFRKALEGGKLSEWGAKTIPEGGYYSIPERLHGNGILIVGDAAGLVNVAALKGIHYGIQSGIFAARAIYQSLKAGTSRGEALSFYDRQLRDSYVFSDLHLTRNMRLAFKKGLYRGSLKAEMMEMSRGKLFGRKISVKRDAEVERVVTPEESSGGLRKEDAVYLSGNQTRDDIPNHLRLNPDVPPEVAQFYAHMCPAGVYEWDGEKLLVHPSNCIDCKATDVLGPRWTPREGGSGPRYRKM